MRRREDYVFLLAEILCKRVFNNACLLMWCSEWVAGFWKNWFKAFVRVPWPPLLVLISAFATHGCYTHRGTSMGQTHHLETTWSRSICTTLATALTDKHVFTAMIWRCTWYARTCWAHLGVALHKQITAVDRLIVYTIVCQSRYPECPCQNNS